VALRASAAALAVAIALHIVACLHSRSETCGGLVCPPGTECVAELTRCVLAGQRDACIGHADGDKCTYPGIAGICTLGLCVTPYCGDGVVDSPDEACDLGTGNSDVAGSTCNTNCQFPTCGDGLLDGMKQCDGRDTPTCQSLGYYAGTTSCRSDCTVDTSGCSGRCGDGIVQTAHEQCEPSTFTGTCADDGYYYGTPTCRSNCTIDTSNCSGRCGDGIVQTDQGEQCDLSNLNGENCTNLGFTGGNLACSDSGASRCKFNTSGCM
jgi:hypothetical protein